MRRIFVLLTINALIRLRKVQPERIGAAAEQRNAGPIFRVVTRLHRGIDEQRFVPGRIDRELHRMLRANDKFVDTRLGRHDRSLPADGEAIGLKAFWVGALHAKIKVDLRVDLFVDEPRVAIKVTGPEILRPQAATVVDTGARAAEDGKEIGGSVLILANREPGEFDAGRAVAIAGHGGIKRPVDVFGNLPGLLGAHESGVILGHCLVDVGGELVD